MEKNYKLRYNIISIVLIMLVTFNIINITTNTKDIKELKYTIIELQDKVEDLESDNIGFENMHADHYGFEEYTILNLIESDKASIYKHYLDSIRNK